MNKTIAIIVLIIVVIAGFFLFRHKTSAPTTDDQQTMGTTNVPVTDTSTATTSATADAMHKTITVTGSSFKFDPATITVKKGDTVTIHFVNSGGMHDWVIDEFNARTPRINTGETADVTFVADKAGSFEYYCSVGTHRQMGMRGTLIVQ